MKNFVSLLTKGIGLALSLFAVIGMFFDWFYGGKFYLDNWMYTKMVIGSVVIGIGFSVPALIYESEKLPYGIKVLVHMGTGCLVMLIMGFAVGWLPKERGIAVCAMIIAGQVAVAFALWAGYAWQAKQMARKMNERIEAMNGKNPGDESV